ncbi:MAG: ECF transporter S component [Clostridiales bacterium]|nr:ECF transporter S component [Clostridiales bacterium]
MNTKKMVKLAMMVAISCVLVLLIRIPFPPAPFLVYDPADIPIYITAFAFGPIAGVLVTLVVSFIQAFVLGGDGIYGFIMHFVSTGAFAIIVGILYQRNKTRKNAVVALVIGIFVMTLIMCIMNLVVTPVFMGVPVEAVKTMLLPIIIPFNLLKGGINGAVTFLVYKRISQFLHDE